jgi:hypothetical protein
MRWQGSVSRRPSREEIQQLRLDGRSLVARARDDRAIARFLVANACYPAWLGGGATAADLDEAEADGRQGLALAERLDDPLLMSAALDGLGSIAQARGCWVVARQTGQARLRFQDRLDLVERLDAHSMVAWASAELGDLHQAASITAAARVLVQPGQTPAFVLHPTSWRTYVLTLLGRWDEAIASADLGWQQWIESGRSPAGASLHCFLSGLDIARAREDAALVARHKEVAGEIIRAHDPASPFGRMEPYLLPDVQHLETEVVQSFAAIPIARWHLVERAIALCLDRRCLPETATSQALAEHAARYQMCILEAQARRALGLRQSDLTELTRALQLFQQAEAAPYVARVLCERGILIGNDADLTAGQRMLEALWRSKLSCTGAAGPAQILGNGAPFRPTTTFAP